jgi:hypothetical protein
LIIRDKGSKLNAIRVSCFLRTRFEIGEDAGLVLVHRGAANREIEHGLGFTCRDQCE